MKIKIFLISVLFLILLCPSSHSLINDVYGIFGDATVPVHYDTRIVAIDNTSNPLHMYFIDLSTFSVLGSATGIPVSNLNGRAVTYSNNFIYACTSQTPMRLIKVNSTTRVYDSNYIYGAGINGCEDIENDDTYLYIALGSGSSSKNISRFNISSFTEVDYLTYSATAGVHEMDINNDFLYASNSNDGVRTFVKINKNSFTVIDQALIDGSAGSSPVGVTVPTNASNIYVYFVPEGVGGVYPNTSSTKICRANISNLSVYSCIQSGATASTIINQITTDNNYVYTTWDIIAADLHIDKVDISSFSLVSSLVTGLDNQDLSNLIITNESSGRFLYVAAISGTTEKLLKIDLSTFTVVNTLDFPSGNTITDMVAY